MNANFKKLLCGLSAGVMAISLFGCGEKSSAAEETTAAYESAVKESAVATCGEEIKSVSYIYDAAGDCIKEIVTDAEGNAINNYYTYNDNGQCVSEIHNNADGTKDKYRHNISLEGQLTKTIHTDPNGSKDTMVYTYSEDGILTGYTMTCANGDELTALYTYNELGSIAQIDISGAAPSVTVYEYNTYGDVVKETVTVDGVETVTTWEYTYAN